MKNIMEKIKDVHKVKNPRYDMTFGNVDELYKNSTEPVDLIVNSFNFGYLQGLKAAKAEIRNAK